MTAVVVTGDLSSIRTFQGQPHPQGVEFIQTARRAVVTGGRGLIGRPMEFRDPLGVVMVSVRLTPEVEHRIKTSGDILLEEEISAGMALLREPMFASEDDELAAACAAYADGVVYAELQFDKALAESDTAALHRAWKMARQVIELDHRIERMKAARDQRRQ